MILAFTLTVAHAALLGSAIPTTLGVILVYVRGRDQDQAAAHAGVLTTQTVREAQAFDNLDKLVQRLLEDGAAVREQLREANAITAQANEKLDRCEIHVEQLRADIARLRRANGGDAPM